MKDFFEKLNAIGKPKRPDIIEKDFHLHRLLSQISKNDHLVNNLVFKGGTCLIKGYTGYYRFSEDIDFTWKDQRIWQVNNPSVTRRKCSTEITRLIKIFKIISDLLDLDFQGDKSDPTEIHISSGGGMVLFFIGYNSLIQNLPSKIKVEINFVDSIQYPLIENDLVSYVGNIDSEKIKFLYESLWKEYSDPISLTCYDPREIYIEKCRALMTRKAYKLRDTIDIYFLEKKFGYSIKKYKKSIIEKTKFMLDLYERYRDNIKLLEFPSIDLLVDEEIKLMLKPLPKTFSKKIVQIHKQLDEIKTEFIN